MVSRRGRNHSAESKAEIVAYYKQHGITAMRRRYPNLGSGTVYHWISQGVKGTQSKANGTHRLNGVGVGHSSVLIYLEKWHKARLEHIRDGRDPHPYDVFAELALMEMRKQE